MRKHILVGFALFSFAIISPLLARTDVFASTATQPSITDILPAEGNYFSSPTATIPFSWKWSGVDTSVTPVMRLVDQNGNEMYGELGRAGGLSFNSQGGSGTLPAPLNLVIPLGSAQYRIQICISVTDSSSCATGSEFTINKTASSGADLYPNVSITMLAQKIGEVVQAGTQYTIRWRHSILP
ncbi:MAG: hypothetical protein PHV42_02715 [Candidatus Pacebacteria bacterium]|nr:hypothetical protein [Candidatus Paceibacterota bacterium]